MLDGSTGVTDPVNMWEGESMLKRLKIGYRLNLLILVPLLTLVSTAVTRDFTLRNASVRGNDYQELKKAQDLVADTIPPP